MAAWAMRVGKAQSKPPAPQRHHRQAQGILCTRAVRGGVANDGCAWAMWVGKAEIKSPAPLRSLTPLHMLSSLMTDREATPSLHMPPLLEGPLQLFKDTPGLPPWPCSGHAVTSPTCPIGTTREQRTHCSLPFSEVMYCQ